VEENKSSIATSPPFERFWAIRPTGQNLHRDGFLASDTALWRPSPNRDLKESAATGCPETPPLARKFASCHHARSSSPGLCHSGCRLPNGESSGLFSTTSTSNGKVPSGGIGCVTWGKDLSHSCATDGRCSGLSDWDVADVSFESLGATISKPSSTRPVSRRSARSWDTHKAARRGGRLLPSVTRSAFSQPDFCGAGYARGGLPPAIVPMQWRCGAR